MENLLVKKYICAVIAMIALAGCSTITGMMTSYTEVNQEANDTTMNASIVWICQGASTGSVARYFSTTELKDARREMCSKISVE